MAEHAETPDLFLVGTVPSQRSAAELAAMGDVEILEDTIEQTYCRLGLWQDFGVSAPDTESTPSQIDWAIGYVHDVLPRQPGVRRYPGPHDARSLLSSPHFHLNHEYDQLPIEHDLGLPIYHNAKVGAPVFRELAERHGRADLLYKLDVPEVAMSMVYFGLSSAINATKRMAVHGLAEAIRERSPHGFATAFAAGMQAFEDTYRKPYQRATFNQIDKILADPSLRDRLEFQISAPVSHGLAALLELAHDKHLVSDKFHSDATHYLAGTVAETLNYIPPNVSRVIHACRGEINPDKFFGMVYHPSERRNWSNRATVRYTNEVLQQTDKGHRPRLIHAAITPAGAPILTGADGERMFAPFENWPNNVKLAAGMIDTRVDAERNAASFRLLAERLGYIPDVSHPCGLGRQREEVAGKKWGGAAMRALQLSHDTLQLLREAA